MAHPREPGDPYDAVAAEILASVADWSPTELAREIGVAQPTVQNYRSGKSVPRPATLARIAELTGGRLVIEFRRGRKRT